MKKVILERFCYSDDGTFGYLMLPNGDYLATVERPWLENLRNISCIPIGSYRCEPSRYNRGGYNAFEVMNVQGRTNILFHRGNFVRESQGCILINERHSATDRGEWCGINSRSAFSHFMQSLGHSPFNLTINNRIGGTL